LSKLDKPPLVPCPYDDQPIWPQGGASALILIKIGPISACGAQKGGPRPRKMLMLAWVPWLCPWSGRPGWQGSRWSEDADVRISNLRENGRV